MDLVTGNTGIAHVTAIDDAMRNSHMASSDRDSNYGQVVFDVPHNAQPNRRAFYAEAITANEVRVYAGYGSNQGRLFKINENSYDSVTIRSGRLNIKRMDLITARYVKSAVDETESVSLHVIEGEEGNEYTMPTPLEANINGVISGEVIDDFVLYKVYIDETRIDHIEACFTPLPDGGLIGICMNKMAEIEADIERIPFDLGDAVNKTYVENTIGSLLGEYIRNQLLPTFHNTRKADETNTSTDITVHDLNSDNRLCQIMLSFAETKTITAVSTFYITDTEYMEKGRYRLYLSDIEAVRDIVDGNASTSEIIELTDFMKNCSFYLENGDGNTVASMTMRNPSTEFEVSEDFSKYTLYMRTPSNYSINENDRVKVSINLVGANYTGNRTLHNSLPPMQVLNILSTIDEETHLLSPFISFADATHTGRARLIITTNENEPNNASWEITNANGDVESSIVDISEIQRLFDSNTIKIEMENGQVYYGSADDCKIVINLLDKNNKMGYQVFVSKFIRNSGYVMMDLTAPIAIASGFDTTLATVAKGIRRISVMRNRTL